MSHMDEFHEAVSRMIREAEARIYRNVAEAIRAHSVDGYCSMGGPQDGDSHGPEVDGGAVARHLEACALEATK